MRMGGNQEQGGAIQLNKKDEWVAAFAEWGVARLHIKKMTCDRESLALMAFVRNVKNISTRLADVFHDLFGHHILVQSA